MEKLQEKIGYHFQDIGLLKKALTLAYGNKAAKYERLEFLGDRVLGVAVADLLLAHHTTEKEGDIAKRFTALVREETLAMLAKKIGVPTINTDTFPSNSICSPTAPKPASLHTPALNSQTYVTPTI